MKSVESESFLRRSFEKSAELCLDDDDSESIICVRNSALKHLKIFMFKIPQMRGTAGF